MDNNKKTYNQPEENVSPKQKADAKWGLQAAQYIVHSQNSGLNAFYNAKHDYARWRKYYMGDQDTDIYNPRIKQNPNNADKTHLLSIRDDVKNYATNIINIVVSKMDSIKYDPIVDPIDPLAIDKMKEYKARIQAYMQNQEFLQSIGVLAQDSTLKPNIPEELMPTSISELDVFMQMNYKLKEAMQLEIDIQKIIDKNKFSELLDRLVEKDLAVLGVGVLYTGLDQNNIPFVKYVDPADFYAPFSKTGDFDKGTYKGHRERMTIQDVTLLNKTLSDTELEDIEKNHTSRSGDSSAFVHDGSTFGYENNTFEEIPKVEVLCYEYRTTNEMVYLKKRDRGGNVRLHEKDYEYFNTYEKAKQFKKKYGDEREIIRKKHQAIYSGYYVLGSKYVFNHGLKNNIEQPEGPFGASVFGYKVFAPNYYNGKIVSLMGQMQPVLDDLQQYNLKIRETLAKPFPDGIMLDLFALRKAANSFEWNGKKMKVQDILEMSYQNNIILFDSSDGKYAAGSNYKPVHSFGDGSGEIAKYLQLMAQSLMELERITGLNQITLAGSLPKEAGKGVTEMQQQASEVALDYLYDAKKYLYSEVYKSIGTLHLQSLKFGDNKNDINRSVLKHTYEFKAQAKPTSYEWAQFYQELANQKAQGIVSASDMVIIRQIDNLKQAYAYLAAVEKKRMREASQAKQQDAQMNAQVQQQSNEQAHANKMAELQAKNQGDASIKQLDIQVDNNKHKHDLERITLEKTLERENNQMMLDAKSRIDSKLAEEKEEEQRQTKVIVEGMKSANKESKSQKG